MAPRRLDKYDQAYAKYRAGASLSKCAADLGVTRQCVFDCFKLRGFELRTPKPRPVQFYDSKKFTLRDHGYYELTVAPRTLMHRYVWTQERGPIPDGFDIHHRDEDRAHNDITNLECLSKSDHTRLYSPHNNQYTRGRKRAA